MAFPGNESSTKSTHNTCNVRTDCFAVCNLFKASKNRIVVERTTLNYNVFTKFCCIRNLDYFKQCIFNNRISKTCGNICNTCPFFLSLFYFGVHKYRTAGTQINRMSCKKSCFCEILNRVV